MLLLRLVLELQLKPLGRERLVFELVAIVSVKAQDGQCSKKGIQCCEAQWGCLWVDIKMGEYKGIDRPLVLRYVALLCFASAG